MSETLTHLSARLHRAARAADWAPCRPSLTGPALATGRVVLGAWRPRSGTAHLVAGEPDPDYFPRDPFATIALRGALDTLRPWAVTGQCPLDILPVLLAAAEQPPGTASPDPVRLLPRGDFWCETSTGYPRGEFFTESWFQWELPGTHRISEINWCVPGSRRPDLSAGWTLYYLDGGAALAADLATPAHVFADAVRALLASADR